MLADEQFRRRAHRLQIQLARNVPGGPAEQGIHRRVIPDEITILLSASVKARVKFFLRAARRNHAHVLRQPGVDGERQPADVHFEFGARNFKMRHHPERVDAGVRAAGAVQSRRARKQFRQRRLDDLLDAGADFLHLPAFVSRAVVGDDQFEFEHVQFFGGTSSTSPIIIYSGARVTRPSERNQIPSR